MSCVMISEIAFHSYLEKMVDQINFIIFILLIGIKKVFLLFLNHD